VVRGHKRVKVSARFYRVDDVFAIIEHQQKMFFTNGASD
jgi:hypothetical protein